MDTHKNHLVETIKRVLTTYVSRTTYDSGEYNLHFQLHFVFYNGKYGHLQEAESKHDGVVVITLLVQVNNM